MQPPRRLRADAQRNRAKLTDAASAVFAKHGLDAPLDEIARRAGVSIGTLYNHFPTREAFLDEVFPRRVATLADAAATALRMDDAWAGFVHYLETLFALQASDRGLNEALTRRFPDTPALQEACAAGLQDVGRIIERAQRAGALRPDFAPTDLVCLSWAVSRLIEATEPVSPGTWRRCFRFLLDGLRADAAQPLDTPALTGEQVAVASAAPARTR
jgi:AcrR family transcriptional regulator